MTKAYLRATGFGFGNSAQGKASEDFEFARVTVIPALFPESDFDVGGSSKVLVELIMMASVGPLSGHKKAGCWLCNLQAAYTSDEQSPYPTLPHAQRKDQHDSDSELEYVCAGAANHCCW